MPDLATVDPCAEQAQYEQVSDYRVLYNIGNVHAELGHSVEAVDAWERYLAEGGDAIEEARRAEVRGSLERQRSRIGTLLVMSEKTSRWECPEGRRRAAPS